MNWLCFIFLLLTVGISEAKTASPLEDYIEKNPSEYFSIPGVEGATFLKNFFSQETKDNIRKELGNKKEFLKLQNSIAVTLKKSGRSDLIKSFQEAVDKEFGPIYDLNEKDNSPTCEAIDLRTSQSQSTQVPREQQSTNWCYAFSAARLLEQRLGYQVSPLDLVIQFYRKYPQYIEKNRNLLDGEFGRVDDLINNVSSKVGVCEEKKMPVATFDPCSDEENVDDTILPLRRFGRDLDNYLADNPKYRDLILSKMFPESTKAQRQEIFTSDDRRPNILRLAGQACADRKEAPFKATQKLRGDQPAELLKELDKQLYDNKKFVNVSIPIGSMNQIKLIPHSRAQHAFTIVGRYVDPQTQECSYILEDSNWSSRSSDSNARMDGPYTIMTRTNMLRSMSEIIYLD